MIRTDWMIWMIVVLIFRVRWSRMIWILDRSQLNTTKNAEYKNRKKGYAIYYQITNLSCYHFPNHMYIVAIFFTIQNVTNFLTFMFASALSISFWNVIHNIFSRWNHTISRSNKNLRKCNRERFRGSIQYVRSN